MLFSPVVADAAPPAASERLQPSCVCVCGFLVGWIDESIFGYCCRICLPFCKSKGGGKPRCDSGKGVGGASVGSLSPGLQNLVL